MTLQLTSYVGERLQWLGVILSYIDPHVCPSQLSFAWESTDNSQDSDLRETLHSIMNTLLTRLEGNYMAISEADHADPVLRMFHPLTRKVKELSAAALQSARP